MIQHPETFKIALFGDINVGKTSIRKRWCEDTFDSNYQSTLGVDIGIGSIRVGQKIIKIQVWDVSGHHQFRTVRKHYYEGCHGGFLVFDLSKPSSFTDAKGWIFDFWKTNGIKCIPLVLLGNKVDLGYYYAKQFGRKYAISLSKNLSFITSTYGFECPYLEISAKTGEKIDTAFKLLLLNILHASIHLEGKYKTREYPSYTELPISCEAEVIGY